MKWNSQQTAERQRRQHTGPAGRDRQASQAFSLARLDRDPHQEKKQNKPNLTQCIECFQTIAGK